MPELTQNRSHNVLLVDDQKMNRPGAEAQRVAHDRRDGLRGHRATTSSIPGVDHRRAVVFVRPDYYVMFDSATARSRTRSGINFWLTPPEVTIDKASARVHSNEPDGANVLLQVMGPRHRDSRAQGHARPGRESEATYPWSLSGRTTHPARSSPR